MKRRHVLAVVCALVAGGCAVDGEVEPTGQAEASLSGGTTTDARPEIGLFSRGCTATLIAPRYVLTAGHCIATGDDLTNLGTRPSDRFVFNDRTGVSRSVAVTRLYTIGKNRRDYVPDHDLVADVLLLQLAAPVPLTQAIPAKLARTYPQKGTPVTIFGFGCGDRETRAGGGTKQYVTFDFEVHGSNSLCPGDSGGPVVFGNVGDNGAVFAVNSGWWCISDCYDEFADAAWMANAIEATIRKLEGGFEAGMDRPGFVYTSFWAAGAGACSGYCSGTFDSNCKAYTYVPAAAAAAAGGTCYIKTALGDRTPHPTIEGIVSGVNVNKSRDFLERGVLRNGDDYDHFDSPSANNCSTSCARDSRCRAITYANGTCWLKNAVPSPSATGDDDIVSAVRGGFEMGRMRPGADYSDYETMLPEDCQSRCQREDGCWAWTWTRPTSTANGHCWLKRSIPTLADCADCISGIKSLEFFPGQ